MPEFLSRIRTQLLGLWQGLGLQQRLLILGGVVAALLGMGVLVARYGQVPYAPLYTQLQPGDAGEVVALLKEQGVPYRLEGDGTTILVPQDRVYEARLEMAQRGLPRGGVVGFETFDSTQLGLTDFERRVKYLRALQGELTRTIRELDSVQDARVHLSIPEPSLFIEQQREPSASVLLQLRPGASLSPDQVKAVVHLVAHSVEGLDPANVTVLDTRGNVLTDLLESDGLAVQTEVQRRLQVKRSYEKDLERSLQAVLERVYGQGRVVVRITADMNFDLTERQSEIYERPAGAAQGLLRSEQRRQESFRGSAPAGGIPGVESNIPSYVTPSGAGNSEYQRDERTLNYEVNRTQVKTTVAPGSLNRLSVAVWIDGALDSAELTRAEEAVRSALGLQAERGDTVTVSSLRFEGETTPAQPVTAEGPKPVWWLAGLGGGVVLLGGLGWLWWRRRRAQEVAIGQALDVMVGTPVGAAAEEEDEVQVAPLTPEEKRARHVRTSLEKLAREHPEQVARLLRHWLVEP